MTPYLLNLLDLYLTLHAIHMGCTELNPLMQSIPIMVAYKTIVVGGLCWGLGRVGKNERSNENEERAQLHLRKTAQIGLTLCTVVYVLTNINHIVNLIVIGVIF